MTIKQIKKKLSISDKDISEILGLKNELTYRNSSAKKRYDNAICKLYELIKSKLALLVILLLASCSTGKHFTQKAYMCYEVFPTSNGEIVHRFANLTFTEGQDFYFDSIMCEPLDTIIIKKYRKRTVFIKK